MASTGGIVFALTARDLASKAIGNVNKSLGKLGTAGKFASIGLGIAASAAAALGKLALDAVQAAAQDERSTILLNAALKQRGFNTQALTVKINDQITAMAKLGIADDQVRAGLEVGSRFFKDQETLLKANAVAAQISAATGKDMADVMMILGKASKGQGKGLKELGLETEKTTKKVVYSYKKDELGHRIRVKSVKLIKQQVSIQDILTNATDKYAGIADALAKSTSGKFAAAQITFNEAVEKLGYKLLPAVNEGLDYLTTTALPAFEQFIAAIAPVYDSLYNDSIKPLADSLGKLGKTLGTDMGTWATAAEIALSPLRLLLDAMKIAIDAIVEGMRILGIGDQSTFATNARAGAFTSGSVGTSYGAPGNITLVSNVTIGTGKVDTVVSDSIKRINHNPGRLR